MAMKLIGNSQVLQMYRLEIINGLLMPNGSRLKVIRKTDVDISSFQKMLILIFVFLFCSLVKQKMNSAEITDDDEGKILYFV